MRVQPHHSVILGRKRRCFASTHEPTASRSIRPETRSPLRSPLSYPHAYDKSKHPPESAGSACMSLQQCREILFYVYGFYGSASDMSDDPPRARRNSNRCITQSPTLIRTSDHTIGRTMKPPSPTTIYERIWGVHAQSSDRSAHTFDTRVRTCLRQGICV